MTYTLKDLGWSNYFAQQTHELAGDLDTEIAEDTVFRIIEVRRDKLLGLGTAGPQTLHPDRETGEFVVGDWVAVDDLFRVIALFDRKTILKRRAAGTDVRVQLIAANVDTLFVVSSCNADYNEARLERYMALAAEAECFPVLVLTKSDECDDPRSLMRQAERLAPALPVLTVDARTEDAVQQLEQWVQPGQTAALLGSSGVGKTTLSNGLTGIEAATGGIREDDAKGRHVTTARSLRPMKNGGWLIDTPGMRALRLADATDGINALFDDVIELAGQCKFSNCAHDTEPGCAVQVAIAAGDLEAERLTRWRKLTAEDTRNNQSLAQSRARDKAFGKMVHTTLKGAHHKKGR